MPLVIKIVIVIAFTCLVPQTRTTPPLQHKPTQIRIFRQRCQAFVDIGHIQRDGRAGVIVGVVADIVR